MLNVFYDINNDSYFEDLAYYVNGWNGLAGSLLNNISSNYNSIENNYSFNNYVILSNLNPVVPNVVLDSIYCNNQIGGAFIDYYNNNYDYDWSGDFNLTDNDSSVLFLPLNSGYLNLNISNPNTGCSVFLDSIYINVNQSPVVSIDSFVNTVYPNDIISFSAQSTGNIVSWYWDFGNGYSDTNQIGNTFYSDNGIYDIMLIVKNDVGCLDTAFTDIYIGGEIIVPNVITPNGDGSNDYFYPKGLKDYTMQIFNRWGELIYLTNHGVPWNGQTYSGEVVPDGQYLYIISKDSKEFKGTLTVLK